MGKMKNLQLLENCFADSHGIQELANLEAINSKLIRNSTRLQKEKDQLLLQVQKQELCIGHLLKKLHAATGLAKDQQMSFDEAMQKQTKTVASMFQELAKSRNEIQQLKNELKFEKSKNQSIEVKKRTFVNNGRVNNNDSSCDNNENNTALSSHVLVSEEMADISDEETVQMNNVKVQEKDVSALEDEIAHLRYSMIQQEAQYKESLKDNELKIAMLERSSHQYQNHQNPSIVQQQSPMKDHSTADQTREQRPTVNVDTQPNRDRFLPDDNIEVILQQPFLLSTDDKKLGRSGLQDEDVDASRPPLTRQASGLRGLMAQSMMIGKSKPIGRSSCSRAFGIDAVRLSGSSRSINSS